MAEPRPIDLRSDTVTRPSEGMRRAMAAAPVGDDVYGEDPTVNQLQERVADLLGTEAALYVPSGSMANQIAIQVHTRPGDDVLAGRGSHSYLYESGAASAYGGVQLTLLDGDGRFTADAMRAAYKADTHHAPPTRLVLVENTHNMGGGLLWDRGELAGVQAAARELGLALHLDGARLWNAVLASGRSERELVAGFDSASVCLSKGLGAPVGSLVAGSRDFVHRAHRVRKMMGGGMRQAGVLAAAGLYALEHQRERLIEDHKNAAFLAGELRRVRGLALATAGVDTNILIVEITDPALGRADDLSKRARARGLYFGAVAPSRFRLVTHLDVDRAACGRAVEILAELAAGG
jgi:threonine aldolase